ncbi:hypothetical protein CYY_005642 [Polysphondylium violaceum]|uniref:Uncharacterized protein n=1 Tax=Polysphondylium violaceum TaxID=133409 RepID=A0A8J4PW14_9MYCE|nr:hypothetical protein CYY_005642 [Polysphondylium violaceum]
MGAVQSTQLDLRKGGNTSAFNDPNILDSVKSQADEMVRNGADANAIGTKQVRGTGALIILNQVKNILGNVLPGPGAGKRFIVEIQDDSVGSLFVLINGVWQYMWMINGKDHPYNNFPIRVDTDIRFLFLVNSKAIIWTYKTYAQPQTILHINKTRKRGYYCSVYVQSPLGYDDYSYDENDDRIVKDSKYASGTAIPQIRCDSPYAVTLNWDIFENKPPPKKGG